MGNIGEHLGYYESIPNTIMKTVAVSVILAVLIAGCFSCGQINGPNDEIINDVNNLIAFVAHFHEEDPTSSGVESYLVLSDFNDYKLVLNRDIASGNPKFSRDKTKIVGGGASLSVYDIQKDTVEQLYYRTDGDELFQLEGYSIVWNYDNSGFYFTLSEPHWYTSQSIFFYTFSDQTVEQIYAGPITSIVPLELLDKNTLLVYSYDQSNIDFPVGFYKMDIISRELTLINNPYLRNMIERNSKGVLFLDAFDWNEELELLVCSERHPNLDSNIISVTDLDGTYYKSYTSGDEFIAYSPVWGPDGKTIIFSTHPYSTGHREEIWMIDVDKGRLLARIEEDDIKNTRNQNAMALITPDF
ncbi:hypothetical protein ACFL6O_01115 [candidate division KSB1 bacterium]